MSPSDRARIEELLQDERLSFRAIARELSISDWQVRKVAREIDGDPRPMKRGGRSRYEPINGPAEPLGIGGWIIFALVVGGIALAIWAGARGMPPPEI